MTDREKPVDVEKIKRLWDKLHIGPRKYLPIKEYKKNNPLRSRYGYYGFFTFLRASFRENFHGLVALWSMIFHKNCKCRGIRVTETHPGEFYARVLWTGCECGKIFWMREHGDSRKMLDQYLMEGKWPRIRLMPTILEAGEYDVRKR